MLMQTSTTPLMMPYTVYTLISYKIPYTVYTLISYKALYTVYTVYTLYILISYKVHFIYTKYLYFITKYKIKKLQGN